MTTNRRPRLTRREAEQLLDGHAREGELAGLLAAARRPADPARPARGEEAARAAFRSASAPRPIRRAPVRAGGSRRLVAVKVLAAAAVVTGVGGAAVAATSTGASDRVRVVAQQTAPSGAPSLSPLVTSSAGRSGSTAAPTPTRAPAPPAAKRPALMPGATPAPRADLVPLQRRLRLVSACITWPQWQRVVEQHAVVARLLAQRGQRVPPLRVPAQITALVRAAGGGTGVLAYCRTLVEQACAHSPYRARGTAPGTLPRRPQPSCLLRMHVGPQR